MKIAVLGGSFNPVHQGHLILADCVCQELGYDRVLFVPVFDPPHKKMADAASASDRLKMVELAVENDGRFFAEDFEIERGGVSYTWDTVCHLEEKYRGELTAKIGLVIGFDLAADFHKWKNAELLAKKCDLILAVRNTDENQNLPSRNVGKGAFASGGREFSAEDFEFPHIKIQNPSIGISSSEIRSRIFQKKAWRYLVSESVFEYIKEKKIYEK